VRESKSKFLPDTIPERIILTRAKQQQAYLLVTRLYPKLSRVMARLKSRFYRHYRARSGKRKT